MSSTYTNASMGARAIGARTDSGGSGVTDLSAEEDRFAGVHLGEGYLGLATDAWVPAAGGAATMDVDFGSGNAKEDYYVVPGTDAGQGNYVVRLEGTTVTVTLNAADGSLPRIDEVYLVVRDDAYDASGLALPQLAYRDGTPASSPSAPGPDGTWNAYTLLASIAVPAAAADILACTITDERVPATFTLPTAAVLAGMAVTGNISVTGTVDGVDLAAHTHDGTAAGGPAVDAGDLSGLKTAVDAAGVDADTVDGYDAADFAPVAHVGAGGTAHSAATSGTAGFMSASDKSKLDAIESGATADQAISAGTDITVSGSGDVTINHASTGGASNLSASGASVISTLTFDARGHATAATLRTLTAANIGAATTSHNHDGDYYTYAGTSPKVTISTSAASGGSNGDLWFRY